VKKTLLGCTLFYILFAVVYSSAQTATTSLRGVVKDPSGALVPGATVTLLNKANDSRLSATTNNVGFYVFPQIQPARYFITVAASGFGNQTKTAELLVNQPATVDFTLSVQPVRSRWTSAIPPRPSTPPMRLWATRWAT